MIGGTSFDNVYKEIFALMINKFLTFTKEDIEQMPPFERVGYLMMTNEYMKEYKEELEKIRNES